MKKTIKDLIEFVFWTIIFLAVFLPNSTSWWLPNG